MSTEEFQRNLPSIELYRDKLRDILLPIIYQGYFQIQNLGTIQKIPVQKVPVVKKNFQTI